MAVLQKIRIISNERLDAPDLLNIENFGDADWMAFMANFMGSTPYVVQGFDVVLPYLPAVDTSVSVNIANGCLFHPTSANASGGFYVGASTEPTQSVTLTSGTTNYIEMDQTSSVGAPDTRKVWDPAANNGLGAEFSQILDSVTYLDVTIYINTVGFSANRVPIAKVLVNSATPTPLITEITDCRPMFFRLGTGGTTPDPTADYSWLDLPTGYSRTDVPTGLTGGNTDNPFQGSDKNIKNFKNWMDAVMTKFKEINGTGYWFELGAYSLAHAMQDRNVHMLDQGVLWNWNQSTSTLSWSGTVTFQIPGCGFNNTIVAGSIVLSSGEVAYVNIDRTSAAVLTPAKNAAISLTIADGTFVFARRDGNDVTVGTHSFRVKNADTTESDYSDHLAKERILKPIINPAGATADIKIYPSQRVSGNKRRYTYIKPKESSLFPRSSYLTGTYDGNKSSTGDLDLTTISFINNGGSLEVWGTLPSASTPLLTSDTIVASKFTPILIAISSVDSITAKIGTPQDNLSGGAPGTNATDDINLPVPTNADYPVAVVVIETDVSAVIQPITESHLLDRRPTGAGGSGGGGGTGVVIEMVALGGETLIDFLDSTVFPVAISYTPGVADLSVIENGVELFTDIVAPPTLRDYEETSATSITLHHPAVAGDRYKFRTGSGVTPGISGYGDVVGPGASTDNALARFNLATGKLIQNSGAILDDLNSLSGILDLGMTGDINGVVDIAMTGDITGAVDITMTGILTGGTAGSVFDIESIVADGGTAIAFKLNSQNALANAAALLLSLRNNNVPKFVVDKDGNVTVVGTVDGVDVSGIPGTVSAKVAKAGDTMTGDLVMDNQKAIELREATAGGTDSVKIQAPAALGASYVLTLPVDDGTANQTLVTDGNGVLSWEDVAPADAIAASLFTAKGDLLSATGAAAPIIIPAGTIGQILTVDPGQPSGLKWTSTGSGNVSNAGASTNNAIARFDGVGGSLIKTSLASIDAAGAIDCVGIRLTGPATLYRGTNLAYAMLLANTLKTTMNAHAADGPPPGEHLLADVANFPVATANATNLATLLALTGSLLTAYAAHNLDAIAVTPTYHLLQSLPGNALVSAVAPIDLDEAVTKLNDLKAKYNLHDQNTTNHTTGTLHQEGTANATGDYLTDGESLIGVVDSTTSRTITLSDVDKVAGRIIFIKDESGGATAFPISVAPETGTLDGAASVPISVDYGCLRVYSDGSNWFSL